MKVKDLFDEQFFPQLESFIFEESFENFYNRKLEEKPNRSKNITRFWLPTEYLEDLEIDTNFPLTYNWFIDSYTQDENCASFFDEYLFHIKYLMNEIFNSSKTQSIKTKYFSLTLNKAIVIDFYKNEICKKIYNQSILSNSDLNNGLNSKCIIARKILQETLKLIKEYLETILNNISPDLNTILTTYTIEAKLHLLEKIQNPTKEENAKNKDIREKIKKIRNQRFYNTSGAPAKQLIGYFPKTKRGLQNYTKKLKKAIFENYPEIKQIFTHLKQVMNMPVEPTSDGFVNFLLNNSATKYQKDIKKRLYNILAASEKEVTYLSLEEDGSIKQFIGEPLNEDLSELYPFVETYLDLLLNNKAATFSDAVVYTLLKENGDLSLFDNAKYKDEAIRKFINRKNLDEEFYTKSEPNEIFKREDFIEKYKKLFKEY